MPKLPTLRWLPAPRDYAERLARWRELWLVEQQMRADDPDYARPLPFAPHESTSDVAISSSRWRPSPDFGGGEAESELRDHRFQTVHRGTQIAGSTWRQLADPGLPDIEPEVGQIRLLAGWLVPGARRPVYVAVLFAWEGNVLLIAPYGPFPEPATATELLTGRPAGPLRVLSLWNARTIEPALLSEASRFVDRLAPQELQEARIVARHALASEDMTEQLWDRVGCPIVHPDDPRIIYQDEETRMMTLQATKVINSILEPNSAFALAAASLKPVAGSRFLVPEREAEINEQYDPSDPRGPRRWLEVWDSPRKQKLSLALDGCRVFVSTAQKTGWHETRTIQGGMAELPHDATNLRLVSTDGAEIKIEPMKP